MEEGKALSASATAVSRLPQGLNKFCEIMERGKTYVDKTALVYRLAHARKYTFLSRPRRFGKSVLVDTLRCYWQGRRELFEGLDIERCEHEWQPHTVVRLEMNECGESLHDGLAYLTRRLSELERQAGLTDRGDDPAVAARFGAALQAERERSGRGVVVLVDEYDFLLQHTWGTAEYAKCASLYRTLFPVLKSQDDCLESVFITGIARFAGVGVFSQLNNLSNISFEPEWAALCGITHEELRRDFGPALRERAQETGQSFEQILAEYRDRYDGYRFSPLSEVAVYNSFCVVEALGGRVIKNPLGGAGASTEINNFVRPGALKLCDYDHPAVPRDLLEASDIVDAGPEVFLYQTGYLTIDRADEVCYHLRFPSRMVRQTLYDNVLPSLLALDQMAIRTRQQAFLEELREGNVDDAMDDLRILVENAPFDNTTKQFYKHEARYQLMIATILGGLGIYAPLERVTRRGRIDLVADVGDVIYMFELKMGGAGGGLDAAEKQMRQRGYAAALRERGKHLRALCLEFDPLGDGMTDWREVDVG